MSRRTSAANLDLQRTFQESPGTSEARFSPCGNAIVVPLL